MLHCGMVPRMSIWTRISQALSALARGESLAALFEPRRAPPERSVAFTIAVIALGAKMAKADGTVTRDEVAAFRRIFTIPPGEEAHAAQVFNLARQDVLGFDTYARRIGRMLKDDRQVLVDLMEGLFHIALADGDYHPQENDFLHQVAGIFGLDGGSFAALRARFVAGTADPYAVLNVAADAPMAEVRAAWRAAVMAAHPDGMVARGVPAEAVAIAAARLAAVNAAWEQVSRDRIAQNG